MRCRHSRPVVEQPVQLEVHIELVELEQCKMLRLNVRAIVHYCFRSDRDEAQQAVADRLDLVLAVLDKSQQLLLHLQLSLNLSSIHRVHREVHRDRR